MGEFKQQFNDVFREAPTFSMQARQNVKQQLHLPKKRRWMSISIAVAATVAITSLVLWSSGLLGGVNKHDSTSLAAPEHEDKMEIFSEITTDAETQLVVYSWMNSMNRGKGEYLGNLVIETNFDELTYGQVVLVEDGKIDNEFHYSLGRVIGKPGDKVAIDNGQMYLNDMPIETFYGEAHIMGTTDVEEAFVSLKKADVPELKQSVEAALHYSLESYTLQAGEFFIVSDNWARNSVRKPFNIEQIEGTVLGYSDEVDNFNSFQRRLTEEELATIKLRSEQIFEGIQNQDKELIEMVLGEYFSHIYPYYDIEDILRVDINNISNEVVENYLNYYVLYRTGTGNLFPISNFATIGYKVNDSNQIVYLSYVFEADEWKLTHFMYN